MVRSASTTLEPAGLSLRDAASLTDKLLGQENAAVKGAQRALVKSLAREWGPLGVRVNAIAPSAMTPAQVAYLEREPHMRTHLIMRSPLRRMGDAENDIGRALTFLVSRNSGFITGQTLVVNGGALML